MYTREELRNKLANDLYDNGVSEIKRPLDVLFEEIGKRENFDADALYEFFVKNNVVSMRSPAGFIIKIMVDQVRKGVFDRKNKSLSFIAVIEEMKLAGYQMDKSDDIAFDIYYNYLHNAGAGIDELRALHKNIIIYLTGHSMMTSHDYIDLLKRSKFMKKYNPPYEDLDRKVKEANEEWEKILKTLESALPANASIDATVSVEEIERLKAEHIKED